MASSSAFSLLDQRVQKYIWTEGWTELRDAQELAIPLILPGDRDVVISAATAAGKTEAAFLPALTKLLRKEPIDELILYISPLKALINDQFGRLDRLCHHLDIPVWPWHGDISSSRKTQFFKDPKGILLITPESVEAMLCNRGTAVASIFRRLSYVIVDELHAFIGSERGKQLQSLLHRIELATKRRTPRIGLSATLGDMQLAADFLHSSDAASVALITAKSGGSDLKVLIKGYEAPKPKPPKDNPENEQLQAIVPRQIANHLFNTLRGANNLVFPNSRRDVELYTNILSELCLEANLPNEFWPHHGSLSRSIREETEAALKRAELPATAICTNTLELGIDIGAIRKVAQIGPPPTVASIRQRLGRSGRRKGESAILQGYCIESALTTDSNLLHRLRPSTIQMAAMVELLIEGWFEPPAIGGLHFSTLVQQLLSLIAQNGGSSPGAAYQVLCGRQSPFNLITTDEFKELLKHLANLEVIIQDPSGLLLHGRVGEKMVNHYTFYAAFATEEEFRVVAEQKTLGTLPCTFLVRPKQRIVFAGKTWVVDTFDESSKTIYVSRSKGGAPPLFTSGCGHTHTVVRQRMRSILAGSSTIPFLDPTATRFVEEARAEYQRLKLNDESTLDGGGQVLFFTWLGDATNEALASILIWLGYDATPFGLGVEVVKAGLSGEQILASLQEAVDKGIPSVEILLAEAKNMERDKWDWCLPRTLLAKGYASQNLNMTEAVLWINEHTTV